MHEIRQSLESISIGPTRPQTARDLVEEMESRGEIITLGAGQIGLAGRPLRLFRYFSERFAGFARAAGAQERIYPSLIPASILGKSDFFLSFPQHATFACHLSPDEESLGAFTRAVAAGAPPGKAAPPAFSLAETLLSSAVCYHCYQEFAGRVIPESGVVLTAQERCFRFEGASLSALCRQWEFTMREIVFLGSQEGAARWRQQMLESVREFAARVGFAGSIVAASDPFFGSPKGAARALWQRAQELKYELRLAVEPPRGSLAVASFNLHHDYFGRAFDIALPDGTKASSACVAFGIERWVYASLVQERPREALDL